eukprot:838907_1
MWNILILIAFLIAYGGSSKSRDRKLLEAKIAELQREIEIQEAITQGLCDNFGDTFETLGTTLIGELTSIDKEAIQNSETLNTVVEYVDNIPDVENTVNNIMDKSNEIYDERGTVKQMMDDTQTLLISADTAMSNFETNVNTEFNGLEGAVKNEFVQSTKNIDGKFGDLQQDLIDKFKISTENSDGKFYDLGNDLNDKYTDLDSDISTLQETLDIGLESIRYVIKGARDNIKTELGNQIDQSRPSAKSPGAMIDGNHNYNEKNVSITIGTNDLYVFGACIIGFNVVFIAVSVLFILKFCNRKRSTGYQQVKFEDSESE